MLRPALFQAVVALLVVAQGFFAAHFVRVGERWWLAVAAAAIFYGCVELAISVRRHGPLGWRP